MVHNCGCGRGGRVLLLEGRVRLESGGRGGRTCGGEGGRACGGEGPIARAMCRWRRRVEDPSSNHGDGGGVKEEGPLVAGQRAGVER
jgi:hypothetical protein